MSTDSVFFPDLSGQTGEPAPIDSLALVPVLCGYDPEVVVEFAPIALSVTRLANWQEVKDASVNQSEGLGTDFTLVNDQPTWNAGAVPLFPSPVFTAVAPDNEIPANFGFVISAPSVPVATNPCVAEFVEVTVDYTTYGSFDGTVDIAFLAAIYQGPSAACGAGIIVANTGGAPGPFNSGFADGFLPPESKSCTFRSLVPTGRFNDLMVFVRTQFVDAGSPAADEFQIDSITVRWVPDYTTCGTTVAGRYALPTFITNCDPIPVTDAAIGIPTDPEALGDGPLIAIVKRIRTLLGIGNANLAAIEAYELQVVNNGTQTLADIGNPVDLEVAAGNSNINQILKRIRTLLGIGNASTATIATQTTTSATNSGTLVASNAAIQASAATTATQTTTSATNSAALVTSNASIQASNTTIATQTTATATNTGTTATNTAAIAASSSTTATQTTATATSAAGIKVDTTSIAASSTTIATQSTTTATNTGVIAAKTTAIETLLIGRTRIAKKQRFVIAPGVTLDLNVATVPDTGVAAVRVPTTGRVLHDLNFRHLPTAAAVPSGGNAAGAAESSMEVRYSTDPAFAGVGGSVADRSFRLSNNVGYGWSGDAHDQIQFAPQIRNGSAGIMVIEVIWTER
jgi:hypothetical protein